MPLILHFLTLILVEFTIGASLDIKTPDIRADDINIFLTMAWQVASYIRPNSSCYVCGLMPYTAGEGLPLMALPASDCDTCHLLHVPKPHSYSRSHCSSLSKMRPLNCTKGHSNCYRCLKPPKPVPIQLIPQKFPWCLQNDGETPVGQSDCLQTFKWDPRQTNTEFESLDSAPHCVKAASPAQFAALARRTAHCSISSPEGMYWVCGNLAYPHLPVDYRGRCGLAYVIPAMRVAHSLPEKTTKRARRGLSDIFGTHHQSSFKNVLGTLIPSYGIMSAQDQIADLSHAIEVIANQTGRALMLLSSELASVRLVALQNRAALDFLLAAQGGTCAVIGSECCTFVPDYNATVVDIVNQLKDTAHSVQQDSGSLFDWFQTSLSSISYRIVQVMISVAFFLVFILILYLLLSCAKKCMCNNTDHVRMRLHKPTHRIGLYGAMANMTNEFDL